MTDSISDGLASVDASASIAVSVLFFSVLRELIRAGEISVRLPAPATGNVLFDHLIERYPQLRDYRPVVRLSVNQEYVALDASLHEGDEVALITPVSGG